MFFFNASMWPSSWPLPAGQQCKDCSSEEHRVCGPEMQIREWPEPRYTSDLGWTEQDAPMSRMSDGDVCGQDVVVVLGGSMTS